MSEIKRVALNTFEPQKVSDEVIKKTSKTIRISVILPESNEDNCPEYNYKDELAAAKKRFKQNKGLTENGLDPFGDDDNDVRRIALEMEAKYGSGMTGTKKRRKGRKDDYADIGMGYDESDSFIDNTDGYDEIIPQNVTTLHGGFYINCGALEFKTDDKAISDISTSSSESEDEEKSTNRKRIASSEESGSDTASTSQMEKKPKLQFSKNSMQQAIKKKLFSQNKIQVKKRRLLDPLKKTVKELLREKREDLNMSVPVDLQSENHEDHIEKDSLKENKKPMSITSVTDAIESVVKQVDYDNNQNKQNNDVHKKGDLSVMKIIVDAPSSVEGESSQETNKIEKSELIKLPENLPVDILNIINKIKQAAFEYKGEGKKKFFTDEVNSSLLNLERKCKILGKSSRVKVYDHLSVFIKCRKETLIRRAKNLVLEDEERRLKKLTTKLKDYIDQTMPSLIANYEQESQKVLQKKFASDNIDNDENKALKLPRRRFHWSEEGRKLLKDILSIKKRCLLLEGKQKDNLEDQIVQYLKNMVLPLWPDGWMHLNALKKVYNSMSDNAKIADSSNSKSNKTKQHSNLTITPVSSTCISTNASKTEISNDVTLSKISNNEVKPNINLLDTNKVNSHSYITKLNNIQESAFMSVCQPVKFTSTPISSVRENEKSVLERTFDLKKSVESAKYIHQPENLQQHTDSGVIVVNTHQHKDEFKTIAKEDKKEPSPVITNPTHCQVIDLTDTPERKNKVKLEKHRTFKDIPSSELNSTISSRDLYSEVKKISSKHPEISVTPNFLTTPTPKISNKSEGDDIQMVMENLKALQKLSSPIKNENSTGSPVSVIAYNKSFSPKSNSNQSNSGQRTDFNSKTEFSGYQDDFQKQFINSLQHTSTNPSNKSNYSRCS